jgi:hypothetical protein
MMDCMLEAFAIQGSLTLPTFNNRCKMVIGTLERRPEWISIYHTSNMFKVDISFEVFGNLNLDKSA